MNSFVWLPRCRIVNVFQSNTNNMNNDQNEFQLKLLIFFLHIPQYEHSMNIQYLDECQISFRHIKSSIHFWLDECTNMRLLAYKDVHWSRCSMLMMHLPCVTNWLWHRELFMLAELSENYFLIIVKLQPMTGEHFMTEKARASHWGMSTSIQFFRSILS